MFKRHGVSYKIYSSIQSKSRSNCHKFRLNSLESTKIWDKLWKKEAKSKIFYRSAQSLECTRDYKRLKDN